MNSSESESSDSEQEGESDEPPSKRKKGRKLKTASERNEDANVEKMKLLMLRGVESIDLSHNIIGNAGMLSLVRVLSMPGTFPNLRTLLLHVNQVGDTGCLALVALLRDGSKLPKLHAVSLGGNPDISDDCLDELGKVLEARVDPTPVPCVVL